MTEIIFRLESNDFDVAPIFLVRLEGRHAIGELFHYRLTAVTEAESPLDPDALRGARVALVTWRRDASGRETELRRIGAVITTVVDLLTTRSRHRSYELCLEPRAHRTKLVRTQDIMLESTIPEIIAHKLELSALPNELRLHRDYDKRELVVQFDETDLSFVSRHAEHLGISFFFEHEDGEDRMVFVDDNAAFPSIGEVPFHADGESLGIFDLARHHRSVPAAYVVQEYNYRTPTLELTSSATVAGGMGGAVVEYGAHYKTAQAAEKMAALRAEELRAGELVFHGKSAVPTLCAGRRFHLEGHPHLDDAELLILEVRHRAELPGPGHSADRELSYVNDFVAIPADRAYRPPRITPRPKMSGIYVALVQPREEAMIGRSAELDEEGRYRVRFPFDPKPRAGATSHPIRMAQPHSGAGHGMHFPLRPGVEVAVAFANGDPDRPIILGALDNPATSSPTTARNSRENIISTASGIVLTLKDAF